MTVSPRGRSSAQACANDSSNSRSSISLSSPTDSIPSSRRLPLVENWPRPVAPVAAATTSSGCASLRSSQSRSSSLAGTAKLRFCPSFQMKVAMPITSPAALRIGPPLLPGEIGAVT